MRSSPSPPGATSRARLASRAALVALVLVAWPLQSAADVEGVRPAVVAERLGEGENIVLDGVLDEDVWGRTRPARAFLQREPIEGGTPSQATEVHVAYDGAALYLGLMLHDSEPSGVIAHQRQRDADLGSDDRFLWVLDTFLDGRTAYHFEINPAGMMGDALLRVTSGLNRAWDGLWDARVLRGDHGWSAEVRIPFRTLNFDPRLDAWGINFQRTVRRHNEELLWSGHRRNEGLSSLVHAGRLEGLTSVSQGIGLEARPYASTSWRRAPQAASGAGTADVGFDLGYSVTPGLRAALTVNTDFAETDVDLRQVNLSRFPLQYPERRQFFLEGSSVYAFAPSSSVNPYFSRRIGLVEGEPVPIVYGARLGGQVGAYELGLLQVRTGRQDGAPGENFTVARLRRNVWRESSVGAIYTRRAGVSDADDEAQGLPPQSTVGLDLDLNTSTWLGDKNVRFEGFYVWHTDASSAGTPARDRTARGMRLGFPQDAWRMNVSLRELGRDWDPAVGFAPRRGFRRLQPTIAWSPRPEWHGVRQLDLEARFEHVTDLSGRLETQRVDIKPFEVDFDSGDDAEVTWTAAFERLDVPFEISSGVVLPPGDYRFEDVVVSAGSASRRAVSAWASFRRGGFWSGTHTFASGGVTLRAAGGVRFTAEGEQREVRLPQGDFTTALGRINAQWQASPWTSLTATLQYDTVSRVGGLYSRLRWITRPGSDLYVVYTHNWRQDGDRWMTYSRGATSKVNYTHRF